MNKEELIEVLRQFDEKRVEELPEKTRNIFYAIMKIADERDKLEKTVENTLNEIDRLNNIINKIKQQLLNKKDIVEKSKYFKLVYYIDWNMKHEWDKTIVEKIDEIINIIEEANK